MLDRLDFAELRSELAAQGLDGWLLYDFHGCNPVARRVVGYAGLLTRRLFVLLRAEGPPVALVHKIEQQPLAAFPGEQRLYATWGDLHRELRELVDGKRVAMEISTEDAVPYLDRVPHGMVQLIERLGGAVTGSSELVTAFSARWTDRELADHVATAEILAEIANRRLREALRRVGEISEVELQQEVINDLQSRGLVFPDLPIVAFGANSASPHYEPSESRPRVLKAGDVVLLDLWAARESSVFADQTWMGFAGAEPPEPVKEVWSVVCGARDAVLEKLRTGDVNTLKGKDLDEVARGFIAARGYADAFSHRTGHSIDIELHGSGPHLDSFETLDSRRLMPGVGFSVEPGIYRPGDFGVRSEVNVYLKGHGPVVTPAKLQYELVLSG